MYGLSNEAERQTVQQNVSGDSEMKQSAPLVDDALQVDEWLE